MKIAVVVPVINQQELTQKFLDKLRENEGSQKFSLIVVDNGSVPPVRDWLKGLREGDMVIRNEDNAGLLQSLNQTYSVLKNSVDYIFYTHNDVFIHEQGWDDKLIRVLESLPDCGVAGFYGAKQLGHPQIYKIPYEQSQLARFECVSGCHRMDAAIHGFRPLRGGAETEKVAVMDGFSLIVKTELLDKTGGFDRRLPPHHMYDNWVCIASLNEGYNNYVIAMDAEHLGGRTDVGEDWSRVFGKTKQEIHTEAHPIFYEIWHPKHVTDGTNKIALPVRVA